MSVGGKRFVLWFRFAEGSLETIDLQENEIMPDWPGDAALEKRRVWNGPSEPHSLPEAR